MALGFFSMWLCGIYLVSSMSVLFVEKGRDQGGKKGLDEQNGEMRR